MGLFRLHANPQQLLGHFPERFVTSLHRNVAAAKRAKSYNSLMNIQDKLS